MNTKITQQISRKGKKYALKINFVIDYFGLHKEIRKCQITM